MKSLDPQSLLGLSSIVGVLYGYVCYGTPLLRRSALRDFVAAGGTAGIFFSFVRNHPDASSALTRTLPWIVFVCAVVVGAWVRKHVEVRWTFADMFAEDVRDLEPRTAALRKREIS